MVKQAFNFFIGLFKSGEDRTQKLKRNVAWSTIIKVGQMMLELVKVPILLSYLDPEKYGVWLTIISILLWTQQFDLGLGSGLRYKLTESIAKDDFKRGRSLTSTAYISMGGIMLTAFLIAAPIFSRLNWNAILNVHTIENNELIITVVSVFFVFVMQFILNLISVVLKADQRAAISDIFKPIGSIISLGVVLLLSTFSSNSLLYASLAMAIPFTLVLLFANLYYFFKDYKCFRPSFKLFDKHLLKDIYSLGLKFFIGQVAALVVFSSANIMLSNLINPAEVTVYNIARTYFSLLVIFYSMILVPFAAAITDAYVRNEYGWIKRSMKKLNLVATLASIGILFLLLIHKFAIHLWVGDIVVVPLNLAIALTVYNIMSVFVSPYANFLGAVGKLNMHVYIAVFKIIVFIPAAIYMIKLWGSVGLVITIIVINTLVNLVFGVIQYKKIINRTAIGIWNK